MYFFPLIAFGYHAAKFCLLNPTEITSSHWQHFWPVLIIPKIIRNYPEVMVVLVFPGEEKTLTVLSHFYSVQLTGLDNIVNYPEKKHGGPLKNQISQPTKNQKNPPQQNPPNEDLGEDMSTRFFPRNSPISALGKCYHSPHSRLQSQDVFVSLSITPILAF